MNDKLYESDAFPVEAVAEEVLMAASPEFVYQWFQNVATTNRERTTDARFLDNDSLLRRLMERNNRLINLAIARFGNSAAILHQLWQSGDRGLRYAVAANAVAGPDRFAGEVGFLEEVDSVPNTPEWRDIAALPQSGDPKLAGLFFSNPKLSARTVHGILGKLGPFEVLSEENRRDLVQCILRHPLLSSPESYDRFALQPDLTRHKVRQALTNALLTIPADHISAARLWDGVLECSGLDLSLPDDSDVETDAEDNNLPQYERELAVLRQLLSHWSGVEVVDKEALKSQGLYAVSNKLGLMRYAIASQVPTYQTRLIEFVRDHEDAYVRCGYYASNRFVGAEEVEKGYEKDGRAFINAAIRNESLYRRNGQAPIAFAIVVLRREDGDHLAWEVAQHHRAQHRHMAEKLFRRDPESFYSPDELDKSDEVRSLDENVLAEEPSARNVMWIAGRLGMVERLRADGENEGASRLLLKATQVVAAAVGQIGRQLVHLSRHVAEAKAKTPPAESRPRGDAWLVAILVLVGVLLGWWLGH